MATKKHEVKGAQKKPASTHTAVAPPVQTVSPASDASVSSAPSFAPSLAPSKPSPPAIPPSRTGFTFQQKVALIGGALLLVLVLGTVLWPSLALGDANANYMQFKTALENGNQSGILMDLRGAPSGARQKIVQCGVDLISSGFFSAAKKDLLVYSCDDTGCMSSHLLPGANATTSNATIPFSDALYNLRARPYFHLLYAADSKAAVFTPEYSEVYLTADSNETCGINITG